MGRGVGGNKWRRGQEEGGAGRGDAGSEAGRRAGGERGEVAKSGEDMSGEGRRGRRRGQKRGRGREEGAGASRGELDEGEALGAADGAARVFEARDAHVARLAFRAGGERGGGGLEGEGRGQVRVEGEECLMMMQHY